MIDRIDRDWTDPHSKQELNDVAVAAQRGDEAAKHKLAEMMRPYVIAMTRKYAEQGDYAWEEKDEIKQAAWLGAWLALEGFDPSMAKFSTYAHYYMRREIFQWKAKNSRALPLSRRQWELSLRIEEAWITLHGDRDIETATDAELRALTIADTDDKGKTRSVEQAGDIMRAKRSAYEFDPDYGEASQSGSAEDEYFEMQDADADALATIEEMREADTGTALGMALDFCDRHGLPYDVADRMVAAL